MKLRVGLVGAGNIAASSHVPAYRSIRNVELSAICDERIPVAENVARDSGIKNVYPDLDGMLSKERLDIVDVCTPPRTHATLSVKAMEAGCNVLVEKPMALTADEAAGMMSSSESHGVQLCVVHQNLFNPVFVHARRLLQHGDLGNILNATFRSYDRPDTERFLDKNHWSHSLPGGAFCEMLPHPIYMARAVLGTTRPVHVFAKKLGSVDWMPKDELRVLIDGEKGLGSLEISCNSPVQGWTFDILGSRMALRGDLLGRTLITFRPRTFDIFSTAMSNLRFSIQMVQVLSSTAVRLVNSFRGKISEHRTFISRFVDSLSGDCEPPSTPQDGAENVRVNEQICRQID